MPLPHRRIVRYHWQSFVVPACGVAAPPLSPARTGQDRRPAARDRLARRDSPAMCSEIEPAGAEPSSRPWRPNRRVLVKAAATFSALAAIFGATRVVPDRATAQDSGTTRAQRWSEDKQAGAVA